MSARKLAQLGSLLFAATLGITLGACGPHSEYRISKVCKRVCDRAVDCNDNVDFDDCVDNCIDQASDCNDDADVEASLDILNECTNESCNQITVCSVDAWLECVL